MNKLLIAAALVAGFSGVASAQQAPFLAGNYSASVLDANNGDGQYNGQAGAYTSRASAVDGLYTSDHASAASANRSTASTGPVAVQSEGGVVSDENRSGR